MAAIKKLGSLIEKFRGRNFQVVDIPVHVGEKEKLFEEAHRAPGTRSIIISPDKTKILLTFEYRHQLGEVDTRLPGGKVFDTLEEYLKYKESKNNIVSAAETGAKKEVAEEVGLIVDAIKLIEQTKCGGMIQWDLFYFAITKWHESSDGQKLGDGEEISRKWVNIEEVVQMCLKGDFKEDRSAPVLLRYIQNNLGRKILLH